MAYTKLTAAEAAALIKNGDQIAMSGFTPAGVAKATTKELAKIALAEHEAGREFKVAIFTGALFYSLNKRKYMHSVFHFFVLAGSVCHIIAVWDVLMEYL